MAETPGAGDDAAPASGGPRVVQLPERNADAATADEMRRRLPTLIENAKTLAQYRRASFLAHVDAGFTEAQALELCCR